MSQVSTGLSAPARGIFKKFGSRKLNRKLNTNFGSTKSGRRHLWWLRKALLVLMIALIAAAGVMGTKAYLATRKIFHRGGAAPALSGKVTPATLKGEGDGRINILLLGIGGPGHEAPNLSDTMIVASVDPKTKDVAMLSVPRDLWVKIPGYGSAKINAVNAYGEMYKYPGGGAALAKTVVSKILDLPIHYYVRVDFNGFRKAIDTVGGVDVYVDKSLTDPLFPSDKENGKYQPFYISAGQHHLNGVTALRYARSRETTSDFDRAARQQKVMVALKQKVLSTSTLLNPVKLTSLIDQFGNDVQTDLSVSDMLKLADIIKGVDSTKIVTKVLDNTSDGLLQDARFNGAYILEPRAGIYNYTQIQALAHSIFVDNYLKTENATVEVDNGSGKTGLAATVAELLTAYNYNVIKVTTAPTLSPNTIIYDYTGGKKPYTINYLEARFKAKVQIMAPVAGGPDIKIVIGQNYNVTTKN